MKHGSRAPVQTSVLAFHASCCAVLCCAVSRPPSHKETQQTWYSWCVPGRKPGTSTKVTMGMLKASQKRMNLTRQHGEKNTRTNTRQGCSTADTLGGRSYVPSAVRLLVYPHTLHVMPCCGVCCAPAAPCALLLKLPLAPPACFYGCIHVQHTGQHQWVVGDDANSLPAQPRKTLDTAGTQTVGSTGG